MCHLLQSWHTLALPSLSSVACHGLIKDTPSLGPWKEMRVPGAAANKSENHADGHQKRSSGARKMRTASEGSSKAGPTPEKTLEIH